jgi:hypothetical protein
MATKLARLVYRMLRYGMPFIDRGAEFYEAQHRKLQINYLKRKAAESRISNHRSSGSVVSGEQGPPRRGGPCSFLPSLLVGWHHQSLPESREPTLSWNQLQSRTHLKMPFVWFLDDE